MAEEQNLIPLDAANDMLATFGIDNDNKTYWRWRREDGFLPIDFDSVLAESQKLLAVDWKASLAYAAEEITRLLEAIGVSVDLEMTDDEAEFEGTIEIDGQTAALGFGREGDDDFNDVIRPINRLLQRKAEFRKLLSSEGSDSWWYGLLQQAEWAELEQSAPELVRKIFAVV